MNWHSGKSGTDAMGYTKDGKTLSNTTDSISQYDDSVDGSKSEEIVIVKNKKKSVVKKDGIIKERIIAIDTSSGSGVNPYANSYKGS